MNAEIYFPREGTSFGQTSDKNFDDVIKKLNEMDVNIIYKTEVNLNKKSISDALAVTESGDERIGMIFIADAIDEDSPEKAKEFLDGMGIVGKIKRTEAFVIDPKNLGTDENQNEQKASDSQNGNTDKVHAKKSKGEKKRKKNDTVDISSGDVILTFEKEKCFAYSVEYNNKLIVLLPVPQCVGTTFDSVIYTVAHQIMHPKKKESFWKRFIPCAGDRPLDVVRKVILLLAICTFVISSYMLINILVIEPAVNDTTNNGIKDLFVSTADGERTPDGKSVKKPTDGSDGTLADFSKLLEVNPDTVGWLTVPNTNIDYVVVKPSEDKDPEYYLYRDFYGNDSKYGTVFMDYRSTLDSKNLILHGHHMQDGRMFANLRLFDDDLDFYKSNPTFTFNTIYEKSKWKIISVFKTNTLENQGKFFNYLRGDFDSDYDFLNFVYMLRVRSLYDCPVDVNENDTLVTLSTCAYDFQDFRLIVVARKVRDGESEDVDVSKADYNSNPLYPDVWYNTYGGSAPKVTSFQDAFNKGEIKWYDGKKSSWSEKDDENLSKELKKGKENAMKMLKKYVEELNYNDEEKAKIDNILESYEMQINAAKDGEEVNKLYDEAIKKIQKVKTSEQIASEAEESRKKEESRLKEESEKELKSQKESAIVEMTNSIAGNEYRMKEADKVNDIIDSYTEKINGAGTVEEVEELKKTAIDKLSSVKTDDDYKKEEASRAAEESRKAEASRRAEESRRAAEEEASKNAENLKNSKSTAIAELNKYLEEDYTNEQKAQIKNLIDYYVREYINNSNSVSEVNNYLSAAKSEINGLISGFESSETTESSSENQDESETSEET